MQCGLQEEQLCGSVVPWEAAGIQGVWSQQLVGGSYVRRCKRFLFGSGNLLLESSWFGVLPYSLCWCELGGALMLNFVFLAGEVVCRVQVKGFKWEGREETCGF